MDLTEILKTKFLRNVTPEPNTGCWLWDGSVTPEGYGQLPGFGSAHRFSFLLFRGKEADPMALHKCIGMRSCVNPDHLYEGDAKQNFDDMMRQGRNPHFRSPAILPKPEPFSRKRANVKAFHARLEKLVRIKPTISDEEIALQTQTSLRTTQRYIAQLRKAGLVNISRQRHLHHDFGWCNLRTIFLGGKHGNDVSEG